MGSATVDSNGKVWYNGDVKQERRADIVIGLSAAGKSSVLVDPLSEYYSSRIIDSDMAKEELDEFDNGLGANAVHKESQDIIGNVLAQSVYNGDNIVYPIVGGGNVQSLINKINSLKNEGYSVYLHLNELPNSKAIGRSLNRYIEKGRFIPPQIIKQYGDTPTQNFNTIISMGGIVDGYSHYSNDVERGRKPQLIEISENVRQFDERGHSISKSAPKNRTTQKTENTETNEIAPIKETSSTDGVFFDGKNTKYSLSADSEGTKLSKGQQEYFKDSKMRDDNGNLKVMYHGSEYAGFHEFNSKFSDDDKSFFFTDRSEVAESYSGDMEIYIARSFNTVEEFNQFFEEIDAEEYEVIKQGDKYALLENGDVEVTSDTLKGLYDEFCDYTGLGQGQANYKVYLNLTNPLEVDAEGRNWNRLTSEFSQEIYDRIKSLTEEEKTALTQLASWEDSSIFRDEIQTAVESVERNANYVDNHIRNLASAAEKLGDTDMYRLFDIATDNFTEETLRENAVKYLNTREYAQRAKEQGYDGVIFKNIVDNGGYSNGKEGASTVAIAFNSNQIKSVANNKPTSDADIRYSLTEYTEEEKKAQLGLSQERLAELSGCHPTYIGQLERGEKNATLESIDKVSNSLNVSLSKLLENLGGSDASERNIPLECYEFLLTKTEEEQEHILKILIEMDKYKSN